MASERVTQSVSLQTNKSEFATNFVGQKRRFYGFLTHLSPLFSLGAQRPLEFSDLGSLHPDNKVGPNFSHFNAAWKEELVKNEHKEKEKRSFWRPFYSLIGYSTLANAVFFQGISAGSSFAGPLILKSLTLHLSGQTPLSASTLWILIALLLVAPIIGTTCATQSAVMLTELGVRARNALVWLL